MHFKLASLMIMAVVFTAWGCGGPKVIPTGKLTGEVKTMNGQVFDGLTVVFYPKDGPPIATKADVTGKFTATLPLGEAKVAVVSQAEATSSDNSPAAIAPSKEKPIIKPRFASPESSGLTVKVEKEQKEKVVLVIE